MEKSMSEPVSKQTSAMEPGLPQGRIDRKPFEGEVYDVMGGSPAGR